MTEAEIRALIQRELPRAIAEEPAIRDFVPRTVSEYYAPRTEFDLKFDRVLDELQRDREEQARKWENNTQRLDRLEAQNSATLAEIQKANRRYESTIGALGSRWGLYSEAIFRNGLKAILEESFGVEVLNLNEYDQEGIVFGRPDQVEIDVTIKNGVTILCEIKSSMSKSDMYIFDRKATFYAQRHQRPVTRKIVMFPMVDDRAKPVAEVLGIELYSYNDQVQEI
ncbi:MULTISPECIES: PD-(D/E)XK nuclease family protein [unclassified Synechocystis]|uniref:PD-(D/E)XK nuclease family protein n=1 Tax=unclassified Synechocystis TaxID=2640012 RepID=UPI00042737DC|nr:MULTISPECIES: DUF3782 domain-containing protein [unclassified Synechocystis]AIE74660.1 hypothetical protein D082_21320 [Synechocystis sp. PCC 6714]MCT0253984.1 DUF3782 domain-containing protein [Synechocystis sp. CS-94]